MHLIQGGNTPANLLYKSSVTKEAVQYSEDR